MADLPAFLAACCRLTRPGGVMVVATINRTVASWVAAIVGRCAASAAGRKDASVTDPDVAAVVSPMTNKTIDTPRCWRTTSLAPTPSMRS